MIKNMIKRWLCKIGFHKWEPNYINPVNYGLASYSSNYMRCERCKHIKEDYIGY